MAADIEFNVRNGMTVGSSKHLVLDVNGALSGSNITVTTGGQFLSGSKDLTEIFIPTDLNQYEILIGNSNNETSSQKLSAAISNEPKLDVQALTADSIVTGPLTATNAVFTSITAVSSYIDVVDIKVRELSGFDIINGDLSVQGSISGNQINLSDTVSFVAGDVTNWDNTYTDVSTTSANWDNVYTDVSTTSANWDNTYTDVSTTSSDWDSTYTTVSNNSADWDNTYTDVSTTSANWDNVYTDVSTTSANWDNTYTDVSTTSANWDNVYTDVSTTSANWDNTYTDVSTTSSDWDSTYTTVSNNSADWDAGIETIAAASDTDIGTPAKGELLVYTNGGTDAWQNKKDRGAIESMYNYANANHWNELTYTGDLLTKIEVYVSSSKATLLFDRTFTYDANDTLTTVTTRDMQGGSARHTLTKTYEYTASGSLSSVGRAYS